jgi:hypothetical protein
MGGQGEPGAPLILSAPQLGGSTGSAALLGLNSHIQAIRVSARGYRNREHFNRHSAPTSEDCSSTPQSPDLGCPLESRKRQQAVELTHSPAHFGTYRAPDNDAGGPGGVVVGSMAANAPIWRELAGAVAWSIERALCPGRPARVLPVIGRCAAICQARLAM